MSAWQGKLQPTPGDVCSMPHILCTYRGGLCVSQGRHEALLFAQETRQAEFLYCANPVEVAAAQSSSYLPGPSPAATPEHSNQGVSGVVASFCCQCQLSASHSLGLEFLRQRGHVLSPCLSSLASDFPPLVPPAPIQRFAFP